MDIPESKIEKSWLDFVDGAIRRRKWPVRRRRDDKGPDPVAYVDHGVEPLA